MLKTYHLVLQRELAMQIFMAVRCQNFILFEYSLFSINFFSQGAVSCQGTAAREVHCPIRVRMIIKTTTIFLQKKKLSIIVLKFMNFFTLFLLFIEFLITYNNNLI